MSIGQHRIALLVVACGTALTCSHVVGEVAPNRGNLPSNLVIEPDTLVITVPHGDTATSRVIIRNVAAPGGPYVEITHLAIAYGENFVLPSPPSLPLRLNPGDIDTIAVHFHSTFDRLSFYGHLEIQTAEMPADQSCWIPLGARRFSTQRADDLWESVLAFRSALARGDCQQALRLLVHLAPSEANALEADLLAQRAKEQGIYPLALGGCGENWDPEFREVARWPIANWLPAPAPHPLTRNATPIELAVPHIPREAMKAGAFGHFLAAITVDWSGVATAVMVTKLGQSHRPELVEKAIREAALASRFDPAAIRGITIEQLYHHYYYFPPPVRVSLTLDRNRVSIGDTVFARATFESDVRVHLTARISSAAGYVAYTEDLTDPPTWYRDGGFMRGTRMRDWKGALEPGVPLVMEARFSSHQCLSDTLRAYYYGVESQLNFEGPTIATTRVVEENWDQEPCCFFGPRAPAREEFGRPSGVSGTFDPRARTFMPDTTTVDSRTNDPCCIQDH